MNLLVCYISGIRFSSTKFDSTHYQDQRDIDFLKARLHDEILFSYVLWGS